MNDEDAKLAAMLAAPQRSADAEFVESVMREIDLEERWRAARAATWSRFLAEVLASAALLAAAAATGAASGNSDFTSMLLLALFGSWVLIVRPLAAALT